MQNILHLINYMGSGGSEKYIYLLAEGMHNKKCRFYIAYSEEGGGAEPFKNMGIDLIPFKMKSPFDIKAALNLKRLCRELSISVIHTHFLRENYIALLSKVLGNKVRVINTRHMAFDNSRSTILSNRLFCRLNHKIIAVSQKVKEQLISEGIPADKVKLIYTGIDLSKWTVPFTSTIRDEFSINDDEIIITSVARFSPEKGHEFLLSAIRYLKDYISNMAVKMPPFRFILVGDGELLRETRKKADELGLGGDIIFTGYRKDILNILKGSDIFVSHSQSEAFGISILEAMAVGLPVITTDSGGTREIVNASYDNGFLIDYGDKTKFCECLTALINDRSLRTRLSENGKVTASRYFSLDKTIEETYNLYVKEGM